MMPPATVKSATHFSTPSPFGEGWGEAAFIATIKLKEALPTKEMCRLIITDIQGREVANYLINPEIRQYPVNTKDWTNGVYAFKIVVPNSPIEISGKINVAR